MNQGNYAKVAQLTDRRPPREIKPLTPEQTKIFVARSCTHLAQNQVNAHLRSTPPIAEPKRELIVCIAHLVIVKCTHIEPFDYLSEVN